MKCPCCSGLLYEKCCKPYHEGTLATTPLILMRSRYSAYALHKPKYIRETTHPQNPQYDPDSKRWEASIFNFSQNTEFLKLEITDVESDTVSFIAHLKIHGQEHILKEKSQFLKIDGKWLYLKAL